jgi:7,8-dihydroneopterin aldolase/epimerase/oxygenase
VFMGTISQKVSLEGVRFFAFHGFYPEEQVLGTEFILDIDASLDVFDNGKDDLANTVNYVRLFEIASEEMKITRKLIETVAHSILERILHEFLAVQFIRVSIRKLNPPMGAEVRNSAIELIFKR